VEVGIMLKISIIIPSYNTAQFIEETIQSVLNQNFSPLECIVIDGGSSDSTLDILKKYEGRLIWISEKDRGQSDAINKGLKLASGDIVAYICADDVYEGDCFQKVANFFDQNPTAKWVYGKCKIINENGLEIRKPITWYKYFWQRRYSYTRLLVLDFIAQPAVFWRKELVDEIGLFDINARLVMDYEYWLRAGGKYNPGFIDDYLASFRVHSQSRSSVNFSAAAREALSVARTYAKKEKRNFLIPLQCLNYLSVIVGYSILNLIRPLGTK
jgi:glycosyltransferase involved in cell wall biosynthesis